MIWTGAIAGTALLGLLVWGLFRRRRSRAILQQHMVSANELYALLQSGKDVLIYDLREPLDVLVDSETIPGAKRISPRQALLDAFLLPHDKEFIIYCTCPSEETSRIFLKRALAMGLTRIKVLQGGLEGGKEKNYPVEPYTRPFHLDTEIEQGKDKGGPQRA
jgi:rhodanese-related sulfurtransferase